MDADHDLMTRSQSGSLVSPANRPPPRHATRHPTRPTRSRRSRIPAVLAGLLLGVALLAVAADLAAGLAGLRVLVVRSGSMRPALQVGDVVVSRSVPPLELRPGDLVTFRDPRLDEELVTHRVVRLHLEPHTGLVDVTTKGDANSVTESWTVPPGGRVGLAVRQVPRIGWWFLVLHTGLGRAGVVLAACGWVLAEALRRVWRS